MKIKVAAEARVSADRKRCLESCPKFRKWPEPRVTAACETVKYEEKYGLVSVLTILKLDHLGRPLRCAACLRGEVRT